MRAKAVDNFRADILWTDVCSPQSVRVKMHKQVNISFWICNSLGRKSEKNGEKNNVAGNLRVVSKYIRVGNRR